ncbi:MAG: peroxiredoxin [Bradymonadia bacterium]
MSIQVQQQAPDFTATAVVDGEFADVTLSKYAEQGKWVVLFFYPLDFTFVCPTEILAFSGAAEKFKAANAEVLGVSVDSQFTHLAWINTPRSEGGLGELNIPLVSDLNKTIARDYGVLLEGGVALRGLFLIDPKGQLRYQVVHDLGVGRSVDETLRVLKAFQHVDETGNVCPANWDEGADDMKPDPNGSKEYFEKTHG